MGGTKGLHCWSAGDLDQGESGELPCPSLTDGAAGELEVLLDRPSGPAEDVVVSSGSSNGNDALDLGGSADILGVVARGAVFIRTPEQDVECEIFDYEAGNQIARLTAREGRLVTVLTKGSATPVRAEAVTWDMKTGRIQITGAVGGATR